LVRASDRKGSCNAFTIKRGIKYSLTAGHKASRNEIGTELKTRTRGREVGKKKKTTIVVALEGKDSTRRTYAAGEGC